MWLCVVCVLDLSLAIDLRLWRQCSERDYYLFPVINIIYVASQLARPFGQELIRYLQGYNFCHQFDLSGFTSGQPLWSGTRTPSSRLQTLPVSLPCPDAHCSASADMLSCGLTQNPCECRTPGSTYEQQQHVVPVATLATELIICKLSVANSITVADMSHIQALISLLA